MGIEIISTGAPGALGELVIWVPGKPQTAGSKTAIVKPGQKARVIESGSDGSRARKRTWRADLKDAGDHARGEQWGLSEPTDVALDVLFVFVRSRPSRAEGLLMVVREAGRYRGPVVMVRGGAVPLWDLTV
jgi:hypothetical protein